MTNISVVIPVGPNEANQRWLRECLESVAAQTHRAAEVMIVNDQATGLEKGRIAQAAGQPVRIWGTPWLSGVAHAFNFGVALAASDLVVMLGSDDLLEPWALADCAVAWERYQDPLGYYYMTLKYMDTGEEQDIPCNAAMVTKQLWRLNGGFPVQSAIGAPDTMLLSIMMGQKGRAGLIHRVNSPKGPPYLYRRHPETDTATNYGRFESAIVGVRDRLTRDWQPPTWTRRAVTS
jgi:glycosyltransferase involved in cell wall biosynthesis